MICILVLYSPCRRPKYRLAKNQRAAFAARFSYENKRTHHKGNPKMMCPIFVLMNCNLRLHELMLFATQMRHHDFSPDATHRLLHELNCPSCAAAQFMAKPIHDNEVVKSCPSGQFIVIRFANYLLASSIATATATVIPTIGLLPAPIRPIIST